LNNKMSLQREYEALLAMPPDKAQEVSRKIVEIASENGVMKPTAKRIALAIKNKASFQTLISDPMISSNREKFDKFILEAMSQTITNPQYLVHNYEPGGDSSNVDLSETMKQQGENPSLGGRKSRKRGQRKTRKHRKTRHRR